MLHFASDSNYRACAEFSYTLLGANNVKITWTSTPCTTVPGYEPNARLAKTRKPSIVNGMLLLCDGRNRERAIRRAKSSIRDLAIHNVNCVPFFATFTVAPGTEVNRYDGLSVQKYFQKWVRNKVSRKGVEYLAVFEQHKDGAWHIHAFFQPGSLALTPARSYKTGKLLTDKRSGYQIYNLPAWTIGYSTVVPVDNNELAVGLYISKYLTKHSERAGAHYYYKSGGIKTPDKIVVPFLSYDITKEIFQLFREENGEKVPIMAGFRIFSVDSPEHETLIMALDWASAERIKYDNNATFDSYPLDWLAQRLTAPWMYDSGLSNGYLNDCYFQQSFC